VGGQVAPFMKERGSPHLPLTTQHLRSCVIAYFKIVRLPRVVSHSETSHSYSHRTGVTQVTLSYQWHLCSINDISNLNVNIVVVYHLTVHCFIIYWDKIWYKKYILVCASHQSSVVDFFVFFFPEGAKIQL
jgi:hypothetical protein